MSKRAERVEATRERIVEAAVEAHREHGIEATGWEDIAKRAGVGVGTVYRHFASIDELLPACGTRVAEILALPPLEEVPAVFDGVRTRRERILRLVHLTFGIYERGAPFIERIRTERKTYPRLERDHRQVEEVLDELVRAALGTDLAAASAAAARSLLDVRFWSTLQERGLSAEESSEVAAQLIASLTR